MTANCLGRKVAFERLFLRWKWVYSYPPSKNPSLEEQQLSEAADRYIKQVPTVWDPVLKEQHRNPHQALPLLFSKGGEAASRPCRYLTAFALRPLLCNPVLTSLEEQGGSHGFTKYVLYLLQQIFVLKLNFSLV